MKRSPAKQQKIVRRRAEREAEEWIFWVRCDGCGWTGRNPNAEYKRFVAPCPQCRCETGTYMVPADERPV